MSTLTDYLTSIANALRVVKRSDTTINAANFASQILTLNDTNDADATANDIRIGKSAYVDGVKVVGVGEYLPPGYTRLEYLESTGTQYIDTGIIGNSDNTAYEVVANLDGLTQINSYPCLIGARVNSAKRLYTYPRGNGEATVWYGDDTLDRSAQVIYSGINTWGYNIEGTKEHTCNDTVYATLTSSYTSISMWLFDCHMSNDNTPYLRPILARMYRAKIWDSGVLVRDMIPVIRVSDSKPGMWDTVTEQFFINEGTGEFKYPSFVALQSRSITPTTDQQVVTAAAGYVGLSRVTVAGYDPGVTRLITNDTSITPTGTYATATYYNLDYGVKIGYCPNGDVLLSMRGGTSTGYENIDFQLVSAPTGVTIINNNNTYDTSGDAGNLFVCVLSGIITPLTISISMDGINATYDYVTCNITAA